MKTSRTPHTVYRTVPQGQVESGQVDGRPVIGARDSSSCVGSDRSATFGAFIRVGWQGQPLGRLVAVKE
jgi:hypothetical protein